MFWSEPLLPVENSTCCPDERDTALLTAPDAADSVSSRTTEASHQNFQFTRAGGSCRSVTWVRRPGDELDASFLPARVAFLFSSVFDSLRPFPGSINVVCVNLNVLNKSKPKLNFHIKQIPTSRLPISQLNTGLSGNLTRFSLSSRAVSPLRPVSH